MLKKFKVTCVSRKAVEGDESFQIWQSLLNHSRMKAIPTVPGSCLLSARISMAPRDKR